MEKPKILKQPMMLRLLYSMVPILFVAVYYFGWRVVALLLVSCTFAFMTEWLMVSQKKGKVTMACFVTACLYGLSLPPAIPFWIASVGVVVAILFGKEVFGGFGRNIFNPAIVGRAFIYICFPIEMTSKFVPTFTGFPGGFAEWSFTSAARLPEYVSSEGFKFIDAVSSATPLLALKRLDFSTDFMTLLLGNIGQMFSAEGDQYVMSAGSSGECCSLAILLSLIYLLSTRTIMYRLFLGAIGGAILSSLLLICLNGYETVGVSFIPFTLFSGGLLYAAVFMVTEPITAPKGKKSQWIYSVFIGMMIVLFRTKSVFAGGVAFSILLGNMLAPSLDLWWNKRN